MSEISKFSVSRRSALRGVAVATAASIAAPGLASAAANLTGDDRLSVFRGRYALPGGRVITGYFVGPRGEAGLDTVVVLHGEQGLDDGARALALRYAAAGKLAVVPDMAATYAGLDSLASRNARVADLKALEPNFGRRGLSNGKVSYVAA